MYQPHLDMAQALRRDILDETAQMDDAPYRIPVANYISEERLAAERAALFRGLPVILTHASQLPEPGDCLAHDALGLPVLLLRNQKREIRAFLNVCRHRGTRLVNEEGVYRKSGLVCPYHHWTYDLDGGLRAIPHEHGFDGIERSEHGLVPLPVAVRHGFIYLLADPNASMDVDSYIGEMAGDFEAYGLKDWAFFRQRSYTVRANWKLIFDGFAEAYHVKRLHKNSLDAFFHDNMGRWEQVGPHVRSVVARNSFMEVIEEAPESWDLSRHFTITYYMFPNSVIILNPDYVIHLAMYPQGVGESITILTLMFRKPPETADEIDRWQRSFDLLDEQVFGDEDFFVAESAQSALASGANEYLLAGRFERGVRMFHQTIQRTLARE